MYSANFNINKQIIYTESNADKCNSKTNFERSFLHYNIKNTFISPVSTVYSICRIRLLVKIVFEILSLYDNCNNNKICINWGLTKIKQVKFMSDTRCLLCLTEIYLPSTQLYWRPVNFMLIKMIEIKILASSCARLKHMAKCEG